MIRPLVQRDFLLESEPARDLYHRFAARLPIIDYHGHLPAQQMAEGQRYRSISEVWLGGDHYKWRAMRSNGIAERCCTGDASDWEKFEAWARTVPLALRNPLYHWTHMELAGYFGITELLTPESARRIYERCNERVAAADFTPLPLLERYKVAAVCTTDDPADSLEHHEKLARRSQPVTVVCPTWRPDRALAVHDPEAYNAWLARLEKAADTSIATLQQMLDALDQRQQAFEILGCRASDHGVETLDDDPATGAEAAATFGAVRAGRTPATDACARFRAFLLHHLAVCDHARGWVQQFHLGAQRNNNTRMFRAVGPDTGFDSIGDRDVARPLARFLDRLDLAGRLTKTILFNLNPRDNEVIGSMLGNFQDDVTPGKMQMGPAWWFLDQRDGMEAQLRALSNLGLLSRFVGMTTDSRSFLSFPRHDYFRRILCNLLGDDVRRGWLPDQREWLGSVVEAVCFTNARDYFGLRLGTAARQ